MRHKPIQARILRASISQQAVNYAQQQCTTATEQCTTTTEQSTDVSIAHANLKVWTQSRWSDVNDKHSVILSYKRTLDIGIHGFKGNNLVHYYYGNIGPEKKIIGNPNS